MATDTAKLFITPSTADPSPNHSRRSSIRKGFTVAAMSTSPNIQSPRTLCPPDGDAFSYKASHLPQWFVPDNLYKRLPQEFQSTLFRFQHVGAAVLTGYERLEQYDQSRDNNLMPATVDDELEVQFDESVLPLASLPLKLRTESSASSKSEDTYSTVFSSSQSSGSPAPSPSLSSCQTMSPISPICLTPTDEFTWPNKRSRNHSFSIPQEPHNAYYVAELAQLRTESVPRLRHAARKVDVDWFECKRSGAVASDGITEFEEWWADKKDSVRVLNERCKRLSFAVGMGSAGMGWTAP